MNETHATVIKELGFPYYSVVVTDYEERNVLETLGYFEDVERAEMFSFLWNQMLTTEDVIKFKTRDNWEV